MGEVDHQEGNPENGNDTGGNQTPNMDDYVTRKAYASLQTRLNNKDAELKQAQAELESLRQDYSDLDKAHKELSSTYKGLEEQLGTLGNEHKSLSAFRTKFEAFTSLLNDQKSGFNMSPQAALKFLNLIDEIPAGEDVEQTKEKILKFAEFGHISAQEREQDLSRGATPGYGHGNPDADLPTTLEGWQKRVAGKPLHHEDWDRFREWAHKRNE